jgi:hypothetical protein
MIALESVQEQASLALAAQSVKPKSGVQVGLNWEVVGMNVVMESASL